MDSETGFGDKTQEELRVLRRRVADLESGEVEVRLRLVSGILQHLNQIDEKTDTIREILRLIKEHSGFDAVAIRLEDGDDFPYYQTSGFSNEFVMHEKLLCARNRKGEIVRDSDGRPVLECMCGNVIRGRIDPSLPFFTRGGSFWTNSTTHLLASTTEEERQAGTRNRCNAEGYETVALVPIRSRDRIIGLVQLNDRQPDRLTEDDIRFYEEIGASIGIAFERKNREILLRKTNLDLEKALAEIKTLRGILPICAKCMKIRDDKGAWEKVEVYIAAHSEAEFSHSLCDQCTEELYGQQDWYLRAKKSEGETAV